MFFFKKNFKKIAFIAFSFLCIFFISCLEQIFTGALNFLPQFAYPRHLDYFLLFVGHINQIFIVSVVLITLIQIVFICIIGDFWIGIYVFGLVWIVISIINAIKLSYRSEPFLPDDISFIGQAGEFQAMISVDIIILSLLMIIFWTVSIFIIRYFYKKLLLPKFFTNKKIIKHSLLCRITLIFVLTITLVFAFLPALNFKYSKEAQKTYKYLINNKKDTFTKDQKFRVYEKNGLLFSFLLNFFQEKMEKPIGYNENLVKSIVKKYENIKSEDKSETNTLLRNEIGQTPDIVYILEESMIDVNDVKEQFPYSGPNPNAYFEKLMSESISGRMSSFVYGGGTAKVEFEVLTSFSNYFLHNVIPYDIIAPSKGSFSSIVSYFAQKNYETTAIHPYNFDFYRRKVVFPKLQFSKMIDETQMKYDNNDFVGNYLSDEFAFNEAYNRLNDSTNNKFMFLITMQNHVPFVYEGGDIKLTNSNSKSINTYYNELLKTDKAIKTFIEKLKKRKKETIVLIFGDHLPSLFGTLNYKTVKKWQTPFAIWDNLGKIKPQNIGAVSPIYFNEILWSLFDKKQRPTFYYLLKSLKEKQPVLNSMLTSKYPLTKDQALKDYKIIEYDMLYGNRYSLKLNFFNE